MCLAIPGQIQQWENRDPVFASAVVKFGGIRRKCSMICVPDAEVGDYVVVHAGIALAKIDEEAAKQTLREFADADLREELGDFDPLANEEAGT